MTVTQISVFVESKPGHLYGVLKAFAHLDVSIRGFSAADTGGYGIVRFVVDKPEKALEALESQGYAVSATQILCVSLKDEPGELMRVLKLFGDRSINVVYCYSLAATCIAMSVKDIDAAVVALADSGLKLLDQDDVASMETVAIFNTPPELDAV